MCIRDSSEQLEYQSGQRNEKERRGEYTPRPKSQIVLAWVLIAVVGFGILGMCYWEILDVYKRQDMLLSVGALFIIPVHQL